MTFTRTKEETDHIISTIRKRYIIRAKLIEFLKKLFGDDYTLKVWRLLNLIEVSELKNEKERGEMFSLAAARKLTDVSNPWALLRARMLTAS